MVEARRFALKYDPPTVILEYGTSEGLFHYRMRIKNLSSSMDPDDVTKDLFAHHPKYLDQDKVKFSQVRRLVVLLIQRTSGAGGGEKPRAAPTPAAPPPSSAPASGEGINTSLLPDEDLNRASSFQLAAAKGRMSTVFDKNKVTKQDDGYEWNVQKDFGDAEEDSGWD